MENIEGCRQFTAENLQKLHTEIAGVANDRWALVANGSYARREATPQSDLDYFILHTDQLSVAELADVEKAVRDAVTKVIGKLPAAGGAFQAALEFGALAKNIGGSEDTNDNITRRILFLMEGYPVHNSKLHEQEQAGLISRYINDDISDHQLCLFLLNDFIRYYRTVCVDYERKVEAGKAWGIRNIKLIFSRKLLYFSGLLIVAETAQRTPTEKRTIVARLANLSPIERIQKICGASGERALASYEKFLEALRNPAMRELLESIDIADRKKHEAFRSLKNEGQHFSEHLTSALRATYSISHPIHRAIIV
jgi:predicted nucleotidyltransferase